MEHFNVPFSDVANGGRFFVQTEEDNLVHQEHIKLYEETDDWNACELSTGCLAHFVETTQVIVNNKEK